MAQPDIAYTTAATHPWTTTSRSPVYTEVYHNSGYDQGQSHYLSPSATYTRGTASYHGVPTPVPHTRSNHSNFDQVPTPVTRSSRSPPEAYGNTNGSYRSYDNPSQGWDNQTPFSPSDSTEDILTSPGYSEYPPEANPTATNNSPPRNSKSHPTTGKGRTQQRQPSNRDEFDGPTQFLPRPPASYTALNQDRELPHLPTNLLVQEQDTVLSQVNDRLSLCAFDFVARYQFPIPLSPDMRPVERPQDREWTEWVYLLKRLATKRRIPARVLYNGQIKQFVTILENSLEMRHAAKHQSRPLKDDRNVLQLVSAGIQVAKILKDAAAMEYLDRLYVLTEGQIQERSAAAAARFR
ncbi:hypothetical protein GE09DRAFT_1171220 [Coniochaeta sp. 2T2.1]|nr:hypothetical protein GE09DRAFT_1171220 [Coniochaeta sp. 2T2.1]